MKAWFVYDINGKHVAVWVNNNDDAKKLLKEEYGDVEMTFLGVGDRFHTVDSYCYSGMSPCDSMIALGLLNYLTR